MTTLVVAHDALLRNRLRDELQDRGVQVATAATVLEATAAIRGSSFLVAIVDVRLSDGSGLDVLTALRAAGSTAHVTVLGPSTSELDRIEALHLGADAYVLMPFLMKDLTDRVVAVLGPRDPMTDRIVRLGRCDLDLEARQVTCSGQGVELTAKEFDLLAYLAVRPGHVFRREELLSAVWRSDPEWQQVATVTEHVRRVRSKIELDPRNPTVLTTVRGVGYRLDLPGAASAIEAAATPPAEPGVIVHVDGRIVFADGAAAAVFADSDARPLVGKHMLELVASDSLGAASQRLADGVDGRSRRSEIMHLLRDDGEQVAVQVSSTPTDWHGAPARRVQLTAISEAPARLRRLVTGVLADVTEAIVICDLQFHIRSWNAAAERIYGWPEAKVLGRHVLDVLRPADHDGAPDPGSEDLERTGRWNGTVIHATREGSSVRILAATTVLRGDVDEPIGIVSVNRPADIAGEAGPPSLDHALAARVRQGIAEGEFVVHYQPVVDLPDQRLVAVEALVRWQHPDRGILLPAAFLDAAERSGSIVALGEVVLEVACRQAARWRQEGADVRLSVNISTRQLADRGVSDRIEDILRRTGLAPTCLWLEVTETALVEELENASKVLRDLAALGVGMSIDDFGTGWASLTYLQSFPVHTLKIDASFVAGLGRDDTSTAIVRSVLGLGAELGLAVIAEGIETQEQHDLLTAMGCALGQGFLYGRPTTADQVPIERAERMLGVASRRMAAHAGGPRRLPVVTSTSALATMADTGPQALTLRELDSAAGGDHRFEAAGRVEADVVSTMLRGLLRVRSAPAAVDLLHDAIRQLGGTIVRVAEAEDDALPIDVSLGEGPVALVAVDRCTVARMQLERLLPMLLEDAREAVALFRRSERLQEESLRDGLTGLGNRRALDRILPRVGPGAVVMLDLDHFKQLNDEHGHAAGDEVLLSFGRTIATHLRAQDAKCRIGGEEFALVLPQLDVSAAVELVARLREVWSSASPFAVTFSAGIAPTTAGDGATALVAADRALYRAKGLGRDRSQVALDAESEEQA